VLTPEAQELQDALQEVAVPALDELKQAKTKDPRLPAVTLARRRAQSVWEDLRKEFESLADTELRRDPNNRSNRWLRAYANIDPKSNGGRFVYSISSGLDERFKEIFVLCAKKAGLAIGLRSGLDPLDTWLSYVADESRKHRSKLLKTYSSAYRGPEGSFLGKEYIITRISEASALCCCRLEQQALDMEPLVSAPLIPSRRPLNGILQRSQMAYADTKTMTFYPSEDYCLVQVGSESYSLTTLAGNITKLLHEASQQNSRCVSGKIIRSKTHCGKVWDAFRRRDGRRFWSRFIIKPNRDIYGLQLNQK